MTYIDGTPASSAYVAALRAAAYSLGRCPRCGSPCPLTPEKQRAARLLGVRLIAVYHHEPGCPAAA